MTVAVQTTFTASIANGVTTVFPYGFKIAAAADLAVTVDGVLQTSGYTVSGVGDSAGGNVTFTVAPANGAKVIRYLAPVLNRPTDYQQFGDWLSTVVNLDFDRLWLAIQTFQQNDVRAIKLPIDTSADQTLAEDPAGRAFKVVGFDADGNVKLVGAVDNSLLSAQLASTESGKGLSMIGFLQNAVGAEPRTAGEKLQEVALSIDDFMTIADRTANYLAPGSVDLSYAVQAAVTAAMTQKRKLRGVGIYRINTAVVISNAQLANWPMFELEGECSASAAAITQSGNLGAIFLTNGNNAFEFDYSAFNNETVKLSKVSFRNTGTAKTGDAIKITKDDVSYPRKLFMDDVNFINYSSCVRVVGQDASIFNNFFGTANFNRVHAYDCAYGVRLTDCYFNLFEISNSLFHSCSSGGLVLDTGTAALTAGGIFSISNTHFEGCETAGIITGGREVTMNLHNVSSEACGVTSGKGAWNLSANTTIRITGNATVPGSLEDAPTIPPYCKLYSTVPITVKSTGGFIGNPENVTLFADINNQYSFAYFPLERIGMPYRAASQYPYAPAAGGVGVPANLATKYNFTANATIYDQGVSTNTIASGATEKYVYASFITKNDVYEGFAAGSQFKLASFGPFSIFTANCSEINTPLCCVLAIHVPAGYDVNSLVLINKSANYSTSVHVSIEDSMRSMLSIGHPGN